LTDDQKVQRKLNLVWGVRPFQIDFRVHHDELIYYSAEKLFQNSILDLEDNLILTAGVPTSTPGTTNMMEIRKVEDILKK